MRIALGEESGDATWQWSGAVTRGGETLATFAADEEEWLGKRKRVGAMVAEAYERGNALHGEGRVAEAVDAWQAAARALTPADDALAIELYENLGVALWQLGRWRAATRALARAYDGDPAREQALRLIVSCAFRDGRVLDGERLLRIYEARFGSHPEGWTRTA